MNDHYNPKLKATAQMLRKNMTKEERKLWFEFLKPLPITFNRQKVLGNYIVDFYCASANLVIELDGSQHYEAEGKQRDALRDRFLSDLGLTVLRYPNSDIHRRFDAVCEHILLHLPQTESLPLEGKVAQQSCDG